MKAWNDFLQKQEESFGKEIVDKWLRSFVLTNFDANNLYLTPTNPLQRQWFEEHVRSKLKQEFLSYTGKPIQVHIALEAPLPEKPSKKKPTLFPSPTLVLQSDPLDPHKQWDRLMLRDGNEPLFQFFTHLMKGSIPLGTFNPIYVWGPGGSGKTHLLMALANFFAEKGIKALYAKTDTFTEHVISAIRSSQMNSFRLFYRTSDILLIDDIQLLASKYATQEEFFHTFNTLHAKKKQMIISSNLPPSKLTQIEQRLISRFEWGINLGIESLRSDHLELILQRKMEELSLPFSSEIQQFLLTHFPTLPSLQKAIDTLLVKEHIDQVSMKTLTLTSIASLLQPLLDLQKKQILSPEKIQEIICKLYGILPRELLGKSQTKECSWPRKIAIYLCRKELHLPFQKIGQLFHRDHSTIMSSVRDIENLLLNQQEEIVTQLNEIRKLLQL